MATTDEVALKVQAGQCDTLALWTSVRRFAMRQANRWNRAFDGRGGVELDDLEQVSFLALLDALERWDESRGSFLNLYSLRLKTAFSGLYGLRTARDALAGAVSLDAPLTGSEDDDLTIADTVPDPGAVAAFDTIDERERRAAVMAALSALPEDERRAIIGEFWYNRQADSKTRAAALKHLRHPSISGKLKAFLF